MSLDFHLIYFAFCVTSCHTFVTLDKQTTTIFLVELLLLATSGILHDL